MGRLGPRQGHRASAGLQLDHAAARIRRRVDHGAERIGACREWLKCACAGDRHRRGGHVAEQVGCRHRRRPGACVELALRASRRPTPAPPSTPAHVWLDRPSDAGHRPRVHGLRLLAKALISAALVTSTFSVEQLAHRAGAIAWNGAAGRPRRSCHRLRTGELDATGFTRGGDGAQAWLQRERRPVAAP